MVDLANTAIQGRQSNGNAQEEAARKLRSESSGLYSHDTQTVNTGQTDLTWSSLSSAFFTDLEGDVVNFVEIFSPQAITVAFRTKQNAAIAAASLGHIEVRANTLRTFDYISDVTEILFTNASGTNSAVQVTAI